MSLMLLIAVVQCKRTPYAKAKNTANAAKSQLLPALAKINCDLSQMARIVYLCPCTCILCIIKCAIYLTGIVDTAFFLQNKKIIEYI